MTNTEKVRDKPKFGQKFSKIIMFGFLFHIRVVVVVVYRGNDMCYQTRINIQGYHKIHDPKNLPNNMTKRLIGFDTLL